MERTTYHELEKLPRGWWSRIGLGDAMHRNLDSIDRTTKGLSDDGEDASFTTLSIAENTELVESDAGATVLKNTAGNPINIQLYPSGRAFLTENQTATTIAEQNTWYEIEGTWESAHLNFLSHSSGRLTYHGDVTTQTQYQVGGSYSSPSNNAEYELAMFKNDTLKQRTVLPFSPPRQDEQLSLPTLFGFTDTTTEGMDHTVKVRCTTGVTDLTVHSLSFTLKG